MAERAYTVVEIDQMRTAIDFRFLYGIKPSQRPPNGKWFSSRTYKEEEKAVVVEELLRTYMLAGVSPEDLE